MGGGSNRLPSLRKEVMTQVLVGYSINTPWQNQTWGAGQAWPDKYSRLAGKPLVGGSLTGTIPNFMTDIARGVTLIIQNGQVEETLYPYQNTLEDADYYFLGGHVNSITIEQGNFMASKGYGDYLTPIYEEQ